ncbi:hypothetical protein Tco_0251416 [Tanacetum coccineum]
MATNSHFLHFTDRRKKIPNLDPLVGIFAHHHRRLFKYEFVSLDPRLESRKSNMHNSFTLGSNEKTYHVNILQSCNGLLLCSGWGLSAFYYVYNPSINLFKRLPQAENAHDDSILHATGVLRMAFDPTKSRDYKVVQLFACLHAELEIQVYSLETGNWSLEGSYDPIFIQIDILAILHLQRRLFESRGCLLLVSRDDIDSKKFTIYEMVKGCLVWTISSGVFRLAFDPKKSSHYKVVQDGGEAGETWIQVYYSETKNWSFCRDRFSYFSFDHFESASIGMTPSIG